MGLSKSKAPKPGQNGFPNQPGFQTSPQMQNQFSAPGQMPAGGGFPGQSSFGGPTPGFGPGANFGQPPAPQGFGGQPAGFSSNQMGFPPFPPQPAQQPLGGFPPSSLFPGPLNAPPPPMGPSSGYPVSYQNQSKRPNKRFISIKLSFFMSYFNTYICSLYSL